MAKKAHIKKGRGKAPETLVKTRVFKVGSMEFTSEADADAYLAHSEQNARAEQFVDEALKRVPARHRASARVGFESFVTDLLAAGKTAAQECIAMLFIEGAVSGAPAPQFKAAPAKRRGRPAGAVPAKRAAKAPTADAPAKRRGRPPAKAPAAPDAPVKRRGRPPAKPAAPPTPAAPAPLSSLPPPPPPPGA